MTMTARDNVLRLFLNCQLRTRDTSEERIADNAEFVAALDVAVGRSSGAPEVDDFVRAVLEEAAHQRERWNSEHDAGKADADWFWLIGYLAGKALHNPPHADNPLDGDPRALRLHRIVTVAAAAANWHAAVAGAHVSMRPGIEAPPT